MEVVISLLQFTFTARAAETVARHATAGPRQIKAQPTPAFLMAFFGCSGLMICDYTLQILLIEAV
jgi:hypothetical protein